MSLPLRINTAIILVAILKRVKKLPKWKNIRLLGGAYNMENGGKIFDNGIDKELSLS